MVLSHSSQRAVFGTRSLSHIGLLVGLAIK
jgi:hypothetical protein